MTKTAQPLAMISDDLTGAADAGVHFAECGWDTYVRLDKKRTYDHGQTMTIVTTDSRAEPPELAYRKALSVSRELTDKGVRVVFKKIDSTLRGNVAAELMGVMEGVRCDLAVITPACPRLGRTLVRGQVFVNGEPGAKVRNILKGRNLGQMIYISSCEELMTVSTGSAQGIVVDARSDADLRAIVRAFTGRTDRILFAGSAGLAAHVAQVKALECSTFSKHDTRTVRGPIVIFIGTNHPATAVQLNHLKRHCTIVVNDLNEEGPQTCIGSILAGKCNLLVRVPFANSQLESRVLRLISALASAHVGAIVFSGGDTARLICRLMSVEAIRIERELLPGIPLGILIGSAFNGTPVCTKSGAFGAPDALTILTKMLSMP